MTISRVVPHEDYTVSVYFADGRVTRYDVKPRLERGVFQALKDPEIFMNRCCVMNDTLAWDVEGSGDAARCIDIDPDPLYEMAEFPGEELPFRVSLHWDEEAGVWTAESQDVPGLILEDEDHGRLM